MTTEAKIALIKDLSSRLPYGVTIDYSGVRCRLSNLRIHPIYNKDEICDYTAVVDFFGDGQNFISIEKIKPLLYPISSLSQEQIDKLNEILGYKETFKDNVLHIQKNIEADRYFRAIEFCYKNHIDCNGLSRFNNIIIDASQSSNLY
jgi:hypothetical protein